jgi:hypothetical protein
MSNRQVITASLLGIGLMVTTELRLAEAQLSIANKDTANPTLLYKDKPVLKVGPLPEVAVFSTEWGSRDFPHQQWLDWMDSHRLGYGRVYAENAYPWDPWDLDRRVLPFEIAEWKGKEPIVDLTKFNQAYWDNFARVIGECADRGIILQIQLFQRVFFERRDNKAGQLSSRGKPIVADAGWKTNYFRPDRNINGYKVPGYPGQNGYSLWKEMAEREPWKTIHRQWVEHILAAVGNNGNAFIDLMNEGAFKNRITKEWIEGTLDIIEAWEQRTGNDILVGMDFDHMYKKRDPGIEYVLAHPRMELIICEGSEGHVVRDLTAGTRKPIREDLAVAYRRKYKKPIVSTNGPTYSAAEAPEISRLYQWASMMLKVQGVGVYAKDYPLDFASNTVETYARQSEILFEFFDSLADYVALDLATERILECSGKYQYVLAAPGEFVIYLHRGEYGGAAEPGGLLRIRAPEVPNGKSTMRALHPADGRSEVVEAAVRDGIMEVRLPRYAEDVALHILATQK